MPDLSFTSFVSIDSVDGSGVVLLINATEHRRNPDTSLWVWEATIKSGMCLERVDPEDVDTSLFRGSTPISTGKSEPQILGHLLTVIGRKFSSASAGE